MSLLDVLDRNFGRVGQSATRASAPRLRPSVLSSSVVAPEQQPAASSRERGVPERIDINNFVPQPEGEAPGALQALEVAGRAPGFAIERPVAIAQSLLGQQGFNIEKAVGDVPILGDLLGLAGDVFRNVQMLPGAVANSGLADLLSKGTTEGWTDDRKVMYLEPWDNLTNAIPGLGPLFQLFGGTKPGPKEMTWGEIKAKAQKQGFTEQDVLDLAQGRKSTFDFGDRSTNEDLGADLALRLLTDPTNLLFGAGALLNVGKGVGFLNKAIKIGAELEKPLAPTLAAEAVSRGVAAESTWAGVARYLGGISRAGGVEGRALQAAGTVASATARGAGIYKKVALRSTAAQLGIEGIGRLTEGPRSGFLEPLFEANRKIIDQQPLSHNEIFSIWSAFHIGLHDVAGPARRVRAAYRRWDQGGIRSAVLDSLSEGMTGSRATRHASALERLGGKEALDDLIYHVHGRLIFDRVTRNPALRTALASSRSLDESVLANGAVKDIVDAEIVAGLREGRLSRAETVNALRDWHANRETGNGVEFAWDGEHAIERWVEYSAAASPVSRIFRERAAAVIGLIDDIPQENLIAMGVALRSSATNGQVPIREVRRWLSRYPQLIKSDPKGWEKYLLKAYDGQTVSLKSLQGKIRAAAKNATPVRELTHEAAVAEAGAARLEADSINPKELAQVWTDPRGTAALAVSRFRPAIRRRLGLGMTSADDVQLARADPAIAHFEENVGDALSRAGFQVDDVSQAMGAWEGKLEPSVEVTMSRANLNELRVAAATLGRSGDQDAVALSITGQRMAELGVTPNGLEMVLVLPGTGRAALENVNRILGREFPGFTLNDTTGVVRVLAPEGDVAALAPKFEAAAREIEGLYPRDLVGDTGLRTSIHKAYIEFPFKGRGEQSYAGILAAARAVGDPRAAAYRSVRSALAQRRGAASVSGAGDVPRGAVGRQPGADGLSARDLTQSPAERVGLGTRASFVPEEGFLYRVIADEDALRRASSEGLIPRQPEALASHPDGGKGARHYFMDDPVGDGAILRARADLIGRVRKDQISGQSYVNRRVRPDEVQVLAADGKWYNLDHFYEPPVEPEIAAAAASVAPAYDPVNAANFGQRMADAFGGNEEQALVYSAVGEAMANSWASRTGRPSSEWYSTALADIQRGPAGPGQLHQLAVRDEQLLAAGNDPAAIRAAIEEPVPDVLAQHGLGGETPLEWVEYGNREYAIPGGIEGLAEGDFSLWDLWRLKAQQINPADLPTEVRTALYRKLFRTQMRALDNPVDAFNRVAFASLSGLTNLTANEALFTFIRARDGSGIARLAEIADRVEAAARAAGQAEGKITSEIGFAIQREVGLLGFEGPGIKSLTTNTSLGNVGRASRIFRDNPDWFVLREGEDLLQYSERVLNVLPGSDMKVGNFSAMLGNPFTFDRGTIDSWMVEVLARENRIPEAVAKRLLKTTKDGMVAGSAPKARSITYRLANGEYNADLPAHLRDLPIDPVGNKVTVYGGDYQILNEALKEQFAATGLGSEFGLGGYQWYAWDLARGKFEPHTVIYPGSHELPPIEQAALAESLRAHREAGYLTYGGARAKDYQGPGAVMSPTRALYYQSAQLGEGAVVKGSAELLDSGQAIIRGTQAADFSTGVHELWHAAQRHVDPADISIMEAHYGVRDGVWLSDQMERGARDFERYLRDGLAPAGSGLQDVFNRMRAFLTAIYARLKGTPIEQRVHPEIKAVFDRSLTELPPELRPAPRPDPLTVGLRALEDEGTPARGVPGDEAALRAELAGLTRETVIAEDSAARAADIQRRLEAAMLAKGERRRGSVLYAAERDAQVTRSLPLHRSLEDRPAEVLSELQQLEDNLRTAYGTYTLKAPPKLALFYERNQGNLLARHLQDRSAVGEALATWGPFGRVNRLFEWLAAPQQNARLGRAAMQALYNELLPQGATVSEVQRFMKALNQQARVHTIGPFEVRTFRNGTALTQQAINRIARGDPLAGLAPIFSDKVVKAVGSDGFARAIDRASNRFYRTMQDTAFKGGPRGRLARAFTATYDGYQKTQVGGVQRYVSKTMYHWFRFLSDPRWWAMNILEADILGGMRYGIGATRFAGAHKALAAAPALTHQFAGSTEKAAAHLAEALGQDTGWLYTRRLAGYISKAFDETRPESTLAVVRGLGAEDPILADLITRFGSSQDDIVKGIDDMLYGWDTKGAQTTLLDEAQAILGQQEAEELLPFLQKVWERHEQTYDDIVRTFQGNPNRSNLERIANSYWLYWPISYQVKATKWLVGIMTDRIGTRQTNLAGAALYAHYYEEHKRLMGSDPSYAKVFDDHPTLWFLAQMMVPITPGDIGVSLSRPVRYAGGALGIWGEYKNAQDPVTAAGAILSLGPTYSAELMSRVGSELFGGETTANLYPSQPYIQPDPSTQ